MKNLTTPAQHAINCMLGSILLLFKPKTLLFCVVAARMEPAGARTVLRSTIKKNKLTSSPSPRAMDSYQEQQPESH